MSSSGCATTHDCVSSSTVDPSLFVYKVCYSDGECACSSWYGFTGPDCIQASPQTRYFTAVLLLFLVYSSAMLLICLISFFYIARPRKLQFGRSIVHVLFKRKLHGGVWVLLFSSLGFLGVIIYSSVNLATMLDPTKFELEDYNGFVDINVRHGNVATVAIILVNDFFVLAAMQISLSWVDTATSAWRILDEDRKNKTLRYKRLINFMTLAFLILGIILLGLELFLIATIGIILMELILVLIFTFGKRTFVNLLTSDVQDLANVSPGMEKALRTVKFSSFLHRALLTIMIVLLTIYYVMFLNVYDHISPGKFNYVLLLRDLTVSAGMILLTVDVYTVQKFFTRISRNTNETETASRAKQPDNDISHNNLDTKVTI